MSRCAEGALYHLLKLPCYRLQCGQQQILFGFEIEINNTRGQPSSGHPLGSDDIDSGFDQLCPPIDCCIGGDSVRDCAHVCMICSVEQNNVFCLSIQRYCMPIQTTVNRPDLKRY